MLDLESLKGTLHDHLVGFRVLQRERDSVRRRRARATFVHSITLTARKDATEAAQLGFIGGPNADDHV